MHIPDVSRANNDSLIGFIKVLTGGCDEPNQTPASIIFSGLFLCKMKANIKIIAYM